MQFFLADERAWPAIYGVLCCDELRAGHAILPFCLRVEKSQFSMPGPQTRPDVFDGIECFVITGEHPLGDVYDLWLGKKDYLLHKLRTEHRFDTFSTVMVEVRQEVKLNESIPLDVFHLN